MTIYRMKLRPHDDPDVVAYVDTRKPGVLYLTGKKQWQRILRHKGSMDIAAKVITHEQLHHALNRMREYEADLDNPAVGVMLDDPFDQLSDIKSPALAYKVWRLKK